MPFPSSPTNGATAVVNGVLYTYNSTKGAWAKTSQGQSGSDIMFTTGSQTITGAKAFAADFSIDTSTLVVNATTNRVGVGTAAPISTVDVSGTAVHNVVTPTAFAMDLAQGQVFTKTATGAHTWSFANIPTGRAMTVVLHLTNGGAGIQTWPTGTKWPSGTIPTLTNPGVDVLVFNTIDGTTWRGNIFGKDIR
jgi:hypothetical protein